MKYKACCNSQCLLMNCETRENGGCYCVCRLADKIHMLKRSIEGQYLLGGSIYIPPVIEQYFDQKLLSNPSPLLRQSSRDLDHLKQYIEFLMEKKCKSGKNDHRKRIAIKDLEEFKEIYETIKIKEKELEGEKEHHTQRFFYSFPSVGGESEGVFAGFMQRAEKWFFDTKFG